MAVASVWQRLWQGFLTTVGAERFFYIFSPWVKWLGAIGALLLGIGLFWGLAFAPVDYLQGNSYRIIFIHVPTASLAMSVYLAMAVLGAIFLVWKIKVAALVLRAVAPIGFVACVLSLLTGSIWAKPTWGKFWVWDARLTSMLLLAFLYIGVIALSSAPKAKMREAAILSLVGAVNLPIIKYSVEWWNTLHQGATFTLTSAPKMPPSMWLPLLISLLGAYCVAAALAIYRTNTLILTQDAQKTWVRRHLQKNLGQNSVEQR